MPRKVSLIAGVLMSLANSAGAQTLPPLPAFERETWMAVGVVNHDGATGLANCTGTLVAPDLVLTAAHCAGSPEGPFDSRAFVVGGTGNGPDAVFRGGHIELHPDYLAAANDLARFQTDLALITLDRSVPPSMATPLIFREADKQAMQPGPFAILGYDRMHPDRLNGRYDCLPDGADRPDQLRVRCPVISGNSGAPVLVETEDGWQVIGVAAARVGQGAAGQTLVALGDAWLTARIAAASDR